LELAVLRMQAEGLIFSPVSPSALWMK